MITAFLKTNKAQANVYNNRGILWPIQATSTRIKDYTQAVKYNPTIQLRLITEEQHEQARESIVLRSPTIQKPWNLSKLRDSLSNRGISFEALGNMKKHALTGKKQQNLDIKTLTSGTKINAKFK